jgi:hypothetical protein
MKRLNLFELAIALFIALFLALCLCSSEGRCDDIQDARARLRLIEAEKQRLPETPIPESLDPVPDPISRREPSIEFQRSVKSDVEETYFVIFTKSFCGPCKRMADEGVKESLEAAGYRVRTVDVDHEPHPNVDVAPQVWLCDAAGMPIRKFKGYRTAEQILRPFTGDGACRLVANDVRWSGVAIGDGLILTVGHHNQSEGFYADFPASFGATDYARVSAELVKVDKAADLSVLRFRLPESVTVRTYDICELAANAIEIPGYLHGDTPKRLQIRNRRAGGKSSGIPLDAYDGLGISSPQFGMSGSPLLTPDKKVAGIQAIGQGSEVGAVTVDTIRQFLADVDRQQVEAVASVADADATPETFAATLAAHLAETSGQQPADDPAAGKVAYGSLFDITIDAPDTWRTMASKLLTAQKIKFDTAGITLDWTGPTRTFNVSTNGLQISPPVKVTLNKWLIQYSCALDGVSYTSDLSTVTMLLTGAPDLVVRLK